MGPSVASRVRFRAATACVIGMTAVACKRPAPDDAPAPPPTASARPTATVPPSAVAPAPAAPRAARVVGDATSDVFRDGNWVRCYTGFEPRGTPALDVLRLGLMCGPSNGMRRVAGASFGVKQGECYRVFVVGDAGVQALEVSVVDHAGRLVASSAADRRWIVLEPGGAFCSPEDDDYRVEARVTRGRGKTALEVWRLHS